MKELPYLSRQSLPISAVAIIIAVTFVIDLATPRGVAAGVFPYYFAIFLSSRLAWERAPFVVAGIVTALTLIGYLLTTGGRPDIVLFNRAFIVATFWAMAFLAYDRIRKNREVTIGREETAGARQFRDLIENMPLGMQVTSFTNQKMMVNQALVDLLGYESRDELMAMPRGVIIAPENRDHPFSNEAIQKFAADLPPSYEIDVLRKDGSSIPVQVFWRVLDWQGEPAIHRTYIDLSEQKRAESALAERERQYRDMIETSTLGIRISRLDGSRIFVNQAMADLLGFDTPDQFIQSPRLSSVAPHYMPWAERNLSEKLSDALENDPGLSPSYEIDMIRQDGRQISLQVYWSRLTWQGEEVIQRTYVDISERKRAEAALAQSERRYRELFEDSQLGVRIAGYGGAIMTNRAMAAMLGYESLESFLAGPRRSIVAPHDTHRGVTLKMIETGEAPPEGWTEIDLLKKDGSVLPVQMFWRILEWEGEKAVERTFIDISERKKQEAMVRKLRRDLAHASQVSAMGEITTVIAHELHQPLAAITTTAGAARRRLSDGPTQNLAMVRGEMLPLIAEQADRAGRVISGIRTLFDGGTPDWSSESINAIVGETCELVATEFHTTDLRCRRHFENNAGRVLVNKVQIQQVVYNLLRNAIEALGDANDKKIEISVSRAGDNNVVISVGDSGTGLAPEISDKLFEPFTTSKKQGMGMGLFTCRSIVESHGGRIWAESPEEGGTIMRFTLPRHP